MTQNNNQESGTGNQDELAKLAGNQVTFTIPNTDELGKLDGMEEDFNLRLKYKMQEEWELLKNKPIRCYFLGIRQIPNEKEEMVTCGLFASQTELFLAGGRVLIEAISHLPEKVPVALTYLGAQQNKTNEGATMMFDVKTLK